MESVSVVVKDNSAVLLPSHSLTTAVLLTEPAGGVRRVVVVLAHTRLGHT